MAPSNVEQLQATLGSAYVLERELGRGGMATVYLAHDSKHGRDVALKVLHQEFAASVGPDRFRREIALAARLQHPNILPVYDSGETTAGELWFTMPYVVGESLRDRLRRERQLSVEDTVRITQAIADALQYAHGQGIVHRDVKPENILLSGQHAMLADFGVARSLSATDPHAEAGGASSLTRTGFAVGTPAYMSPEQATGSRDIDGRSDQHALAIVAYEMLAGEPPFSAPTPQAAIAKMLASPPPSIRIVRRDVPVGIDAALRKALNTAPAARYLSASDFSTALARGVDSGTVDTRPPSAWHALIVAALVLAAVVGSVIGYLHYRQPAGPTMLAVLPFETEGDTADTWITDGITDEVRGKLAALSGLRVIARASSNEYRRTTKHPEVIGRELGVRYLLMGRIRWDAGTGQQRRIRVEPELVQVADVRTPQTTWEQSFDEQQSDAFRLQADIAERVASALQVALNPTERTAIARLPTRDPEAYYAYLRGTALARTGKPGDEVRARDEFRRAVTLDSTYVDAWDALSLNISAWGARHPSPPAFDDSALMAANRALALSPDLPEAMGRRAYYYEVIKLDLPRAVADFQAGLARAPNDGFLLGGLASAEQRLGMWDSTVAHSERSVLLNPRSPGLQNFLGNTYLLVRRFNDAHSACERANELVPNNTFTVFCLIQIPLAQGDLAGARAIIRAASPGIDSTTMYSFLASYGAYVWVLDTAQLKALLALPFGAFDRGHASWLYTRMLAYDRLGDSVMTSAYADSARVAYETDYPIVTADSVPEYGQVLAFLHRPSDAVAAADRFLSAHPLESDYLDAPDNAEAVAKTYARAGANAKAIGLLERLLRMPGRLTPGRLRLDPAFAPLRADPRFQRLVGS